MDYIKENLRISSDYLKTLIKWLMVSLVVGVIGGVIGSLFHLSIDFVTKTREQHSFIILFLPVGGIVIAAIYAIFKSKGRLDTNRVLEAVEAEEKVPLCLTPLIFISTCITHLLGGSAGREGAALQLGGSIGYNLGRVFKMNSEDLHIIVMSGMSAVFAALFGTPITAAFFSLEVVRVGIMHYASLVPCVLSALCAYLIAGKFGISPVAFTVAPQQISVLLIVKIIILAVLCALVSILFCAAIKYTEHYSEKLIPNNYLRAFAGGLLIVILSFCLRTTDYNGAGMHVITRAINGEADYFAFFIKIVFTAITISAGFKGGEIVPAFFIGSTFGCIAGSFLGMDAGFSAAVGFVAVFCGVVNCPVASVMLAMEVFGIDSVLLFALVCSISYMMSGCSGLYKSQKIEYSKLCMGKLEEKTK